MTRTGSHLLLALPLLAVPVACVNHDGTSESQSSTTFVDSSGGGSVRIDGVRIEAEGSVHFLYRSTSTTPGTTTTTMTIEGHPYGVRDGVFFLGDREYGPVGKTSVVRVSHDGVTIDGEPRGELPPPEPTEEGH